MPVDPRSLTDLVVLLEAGGRLPGLCAAFVQRLAELSGAEAVGVLQSLGDFPLLLGQAGGLGLEAALALVDRAGQSWNVEGGHLVARGASAEGGEVLALGARLLAGHLSRRLELRRAQRSQESMTAATHAMNNYLTTLFASESSSVVREAQRLKLQLDCLRSLRGKERMREVQRVPAFLERVRDFLSYRPGGRYPVHVAATSDVEARVVGLGVDLLPALVNAGYAMRGAGTEISLSASLQDGSLCFVLEVQAEDPADLVGDLELPPTLSVAFTVQVDQRCVRVTLRVVQPPGVLILHGETPLGSLEVFEELGVTLRPCASLEEVLECVRDDADRWIVLVTVEAQALGRKLRRSLLMENPTFALRGVLFEGGPPLPGADVRKQVDLAALRSSPREVLPQSPRAQ